MKKTILSTLTLLTLLAVVWGSSSILRTGFFGFGSPSFEAYANEIVALCRSASYQPACYDREIPKLMDRGLTMEETFRVTGLIQGKVENYYFCHVLGHELAAKETAKDPTAWTEVIARCPVGMCSNGCVHGAAQERFRAESLPPAEAEKHISEVASICETGAGTTFTNLERASCYHSLGHLFMYMTGADVPTATRMCGAVTKTNTRSDFTQFCYEGVFMQIFQPLEPEDIALVKHIPASTPASANMFCDRFTGEQRAACHRESWPLYFEALRTASGVESFCATLPGARYQTECYESVFYLMTAQFNFDENRIASFCAEFPDKRKAQCFANVASRYIETDHRLISKAVGMCTRAADAGLEERCYQELLFYSTYNFHKDSAEFNMLCAALPEPWSTKCKNGEGSRVSIGTLDN